MRENPLVRGVRSTPYGLVNLTQLARESRGKREREIETENKNRESTWEVERRRKRRPGHLLLAVGGGSAASRAVNFVQNSIGGTI